MSAVIVASEPQLMEHGLPLIAVFKGAGLALSITAGFYTSEVCQELFSKGLNAGARLEPKHIKA